MDDAEKERKRKALAAMMGSESVSDIGTDFEEKKPEPPPVNRACRDCNGAGKCQVCQGSGAEECRTCSGSGRVGAYHTQVIKGADRTIVNQASGFGGTCPDCGGRGRKTELWPMTKSVPCKYCKGTGKCGRCSGTGSVESR
jgi:RecJ-like exonuclease